MTSRTPPPSVHAPKKRGRPRRYGDKIQVASLVVDDGAMSHGLSPIDGETAVTLRYRAVDLLWRPVGILVRFVSVCHPHRGSIVLMCTDLTLAPLDIIRIYGLRFKIELSFKQALRVVGAYAYHFWMAAMTPISRKSGAPYLHCKAAVYRDAVRRKLVAYHRHIQLGLVAQGVLQLLAATVPALVWRSFGSWLRTIRPGLALSEQVVAIALRHSLPHFLGDEAHASILTKCLRARIDVSRSEGIRLVA